MMGRFYCHSCTRPTEEAALYSGGCCRVSFFTGRGAWLRVCPCGGILDYVYHNLGKCRDCGSWKALW